MSDTESEISKVLTEDVRFFLTIGTVIVSITISYMAMMNEINVLKVQSDAMRNDIATIQNNHLAHLQAAIDKISDKLSTHLEEK